MTAVDKIKELNEAFDSSYQIIKKDTVTEFNVVRYYFYVNQFQYRIFIERSEDNKDIEVGFERLYNNRWIRYGETNDLETKQVLSLFGTLYEVISKQKFDNLYISTNEAKKFRIYNKMITRLSKALNAEYSESGDYMILTKSKPSNFIPKFKYGKSNG